MVRREMETRTSRRLVDQYAFDGARYLIVRLIVTSIVIIIIITTIVIFLAIIQSYPF